MQQAVRPFYQQVRPCEVGCESRPRVRCMPRDGCAMPCPPALKGLSGLRSVLGPPPRPLIHSSHICELSQVMGGRQAGCSARAMSGTPHRLLLRLSNYARRPPRFGARQGPSITPCGAAAAAAAVGRVRLFTEVAETRVPYQSPHTLLSCLFTSKAFQQSDFEGACCAAVSSSEWSRA